MDARAERRVLQALFAALEHRERAAELGATGDDDGVAAVARRHRLSPLLSSRCRGALPRRLEEMFRRDHVLTTARNLALAGAAEECVAALAAAGVQAVLLKGLAYERTLYEQPGTRPTSDVDVLVRERDRRAAFAVLDALGFEPKAAAPGFDDPDYHEVAWRRGHVEIDLHLALAPHVRGAIDHQDVWRQVTPLEVGAARAFALAPPHAAAFHALHMAIDHFDVPGLYLIDLARLAPTADDAAAAAATARAWRYARPWATSVALAGAFQPTWPVAPRPDAIPRRAAEVVQGFGATAALPRPRQLARKFAHFDTPADALRYTLVQGRRHLREAVERRLRRRSARARLGL